MGSNKSQQAKNSCKSVQSNKKISKIYKESHKFAWNGPKWSKIVHYGPIWDNMIYYGLIWSKFYLQNLV